MGLPQEIINKLSLKKGTKLAIECRHNGFVVCKIEHYQNWLDKLDSELLELDVYSRQMFSKSLNTLNKKDKENRVKEDKPSLTKTEVL